jgi:hypothetical protein
MNFSFKVGLPVFRMKQNQLETPMAFLGKWSITSDALLFSTELVIRQQGKKYIGELIILKNDGSSETYNIENIVLSGGKIGFGITWQLIRVSPSVSISGRWLIFGELGEDQKNITGKIHAYGFEAHVKEFKEFHWSANKKT